MPGREDLRYRRSGGQLQCATAHRPFVESQLKIKIRLV